MAILLNGYFSLYNYLLLSNEESYFRLFKARIWVRNISSVILTKEILKHITIIYRKKEKSIITL